MSEETPTYAPWRLANPLVMAKDRPKAPNMLTRTDGEGLLYQGQLNVLYGEPESGKSWLALVACWEEMQAGNHIFYFDFEADANTIVERLAAMEIPEDLIAEYFHYADQNQLSEPLSIELWEETIEPQIREREYPPSLVVLDGVTEAMTLQSLDTKDEVGAAKFFGLLVRKWLNYGITVVQIDHVPKNAHNKGYAFGSQHKKAIVKGSQLSVSISDAARPGQGRSGRIDVTVEKDNAGYLRGISGVGGKVAEVMVVALDTEGHVEFSVEPAMSGAEAKDASIRTIENRMLDYLRDHEDQSFTKTELKTAVKGSNDKKQVALTNLITEAKVTLSGSEATPRVSYRDTSPDQPKEL